jgi:hypothetical protein
MVVSVWEQKILEMFEVRKKGELVHGGSIVLMTLILGSPALA